MENLQRKTNQSRHAKPRVVGFQSKNTTQRIFCTWLKENNITLGFSDLSKNQESSKRSRSSHTRKNNISLFDAPTDSSESTSSFALSFDKTTKTSDLSAIPRRSLDGLYQELILFDEIDFTMTFQLISHALKPSAPFGILLLIPRKKPTRISRRQVIAGLGTNSSSTFSVLRRCADKYNIVIDAIQEKRALLSKNTWMDIHDNISSRGETWNSILNSRHFPGDSNEIASFLASKMDYSVILLCGHRID